MCEAEAENSFSGSVWLPFVPRLLELGFSVNHRHIEYLCHFGTTVFCTPETNTTHCHH